jgi:hypothetical protein
LDHSVPPVDDHVTSAAGENAYHGAAFTTTHWSVVLAAQVHRQLHKRHSKDFAAHTGDQFMAL